MRGCLIQCFLECGAYLIHAPLVPPKKKFRPLHNLCTSGHGKLSKVAADGDAYTNGVCEAKVIRPLGTINCRAKFETELHYCTQLRDLVERKL